MRKHISRKYIGREIIETGFGWIQLDTGEKLYIEED